MGGFKIGAQVCNNCVHWQCHAKRIFTKTEVQTTSNCDKCGLSGRNTYSDGTCEAFSHIGGVTKTFAYVHEPSISDYYMQAMQGELKMKAAHAAELAEIQRRREEQQRQEDQRRARVKAELDEKLAENGMDPNADKVTRAWFLMTLNDARQGSVRDQLQLGDAFYEGHPGVIASKREAVRWYRRAAENGEEEAQYKLGECYYFGRGVTEDEVESIIWYEKAARQGNVNSMARLAKMYYSARHRDYAKAFKWAKQGVEHDNYECHFILGKCYYFGHETEVDADSAFKHFKEAAYRDVVGAGLFLATCYRKGIGTSDLV